jgi:capsular polysaccharide transport system ATP-binding protein
MIRLDHVTREYETRHGPVRVLDDVSFTLPRGRKMGLIGLNGSGKSTLMRLVGGIEQPSSGRVQREMSVSWPLAFSGAFQASLTGLDNLKFICRIYGLPVGDKVEALQEFAQLGRYLNEPVKTYSAGMRARLAFGISLIVEFDCFLVDEVVAVGDSRFQERCEYELFEKRADRALLMASHHDAYIRQRCDSAGVLVRGKLHHFDDVGEAFDFYARASATAAVAPA